MTDTKPAQKKNHVLQDCQKSVQPEVEILVGGMPCKGFSSEMHASMRKVKKHFK